MMHKVLSPSQNVTTLGVSSSNQTFLTISLWTTWSEVQSRGGMEQLSGRHAAAVFLFIFVF